MTTKQMEKVRAQEQQQQFGVGQTRNHKTRQQDGDDDEYSLSSSMVASSNWPMSCICKLCNCGGHRCSNFALERGALFDQQGRLLLLNDGRGMDSCDGNNNNNNEGDGHMNCLHHHCNYSAANERYLTRPASVVGQANKTASVTPTASRRRRQQQQTVSSSTNTRTMPTRRDNSKQQQLDDDDDGEDDIEQPADDEYDDQDDDGRDANEQEQHQLLHVLITKPEIASKPRDNIVFEGDMDLKTTFETSYDALAKLRLDHWKRYQESSRTGPLGAGSMGQREQTKSSGGSGGGGFINQSNRGGPRQGRKSPISRKSHADAGREKRFAGDEQDDEEEEEVEERREDVDDEGRVVVGQPGKQQQRQRREKQREKSDVSVESNNNDNNRSRSQQRKSQGAAAAATGSPSTFCNRQNFVDFDGHEDGAAGGAEKLPSQMADAKQPNRAIGKSDAVVAKSRHQQQRVGGGGGSRPRRDIVGATTDHDDVEQRQPARRDRLRRVETVPPEGLRMSSGGGNNNTLVSNKLGTDKRKPSPLISSKTLTAQRTSALRDENLASDVTQEAAASAAPTSAAATKQSATTTPVAVAADRRTGSGLTNVKTNISQRSSPAAAVAPATPIKPPLQRDPNETTPTTLNDQRQQQQLQQQLKSTHIDPDLSSIIVYDANMNRLERVGLRKRSKYRPSTSLRSGARGLFGDQEEQEQPTAAAAKATPIGAANTARDDGQNLTAAGLPISRGSNRSRQDGVLTPINDSTTTTTTTNHHDQPLTYSDQNLPIDSKRRFADNVNMTDHLKEQATDEELRLKRFISTGTLTEPVGARDHDNDMTGGERNVNGEQPTAAEAATISGYSETDMQTMLRLAEQEEAAAVEEIRRCTTGDGSSVQQPAQKQQQHSSDGMKSVNSQNSTNLDSRQSKLQRTCQYQSFYLFENDYPEPKEQQRQHDLTAIGFGRSISPVATGSNVVASRAINQRGGHTNLFRESPDFMLTTGKHQQQQHSMQKRDIIENGRNDDDDDNSRANHHQNQSRTESRAAGNYSRSSNANNNDGLIGGGGGDGRASNGFMDDNTSRMNNQSFVDRQQDDSANKHSAADWMEDDHHGYEMTASHTPNACKVLCLGTDFEFVGHKSGHKYFVEKHLDSYECDQ